jgi:hypothetical protein
MLLMVIDVVPLFVNVTAFGAPFPPTGTEAQVRGVGLTDALLVVPLGAKPERATVCGLGVALSLKFKVAVRVPLTVGAKRTFTVQVAEGARLDPQVFEEIWKSCGLAPDSVMLLIARVAAPLFVSVTIFCAPFPPIATEAQL